MEVDIGFFKKVYSEDIIYHYTKASIAIDYILFNNQLRFNPSRNSHDPIESRKASRGTFYTGTKADEIVSTSVTSDADDLHRYISSLENQFHQICFCKNRKGGSFADEYYYSRFSGYEELFGFTKLRMWDQYADNYTGVCLAFSKEKIISKNAAEFDLLADDVKYLTFRELSDAKIGDIYGNYLLEVGKAEYKKLIDERVKKSFFLKHKDYSSEDEYRIGTFYDKSICCVENNRGELVLCRTMMLDISDCVEGIFVSSYANYKQKTELLAYAKRLDVPIIEMKWQYDSFEAIDYKESMEFAGKIRLEILNKESES